MPRSRTHAFLFAAVLGTCGAPMLAADVSWTNPAGGSFADSGNWMAGPPGISDTAIFNINSAYSVTFSAEVSNQQFRVGNDNVTLALNGRTYSITTAGTGYAVQVGTSSGQIGRLTVAGGTITANNSVFGNAAGAAGIGTVSAGARWTNNGSLTLGENGSGSLNIFGVMTAGQTRVGRQAGATGTIIVDGASANFSTPGTGMLVGSIGNGTFIIRNGGNYSDQGSFLSGFGGSGFASISGAGSTWTSVDGLYIGYQGPAALVLSSGGRFVQTGADFLTTLGVLGGSNGTMTIGGGSGMQLAAQLAVGGDGSGSIECSGTILSAKATTDTHGFIGMGTTGIGSVSLVGSAANWSGDGALAVGYEGRGTLNLADGGSADSDQGHVARFFGSQGFVRVQGAGSRWTTPDGIFVGGYDADEGGSGTLIFGAGGRIEAGSLLKAWQSGTILWQTGGQLATDAAAVLGLMQMSSGHDKILKVQSLVIETATGGALDITDNAAIVDYTGSPSPADDIRADLITGRAGGTWTGPGIRSSIAAANNLAVGYAQATDIFTSFPATFLGQSIDNTTVLIRTTLNGDANLDGTVNIGDFSQLAANFNVLTGKWARGDFNYDGTTNIGDFSLLASNFNQSLPAETPGRGGAESSVPEPTVGALILAATLARRRRRQTNRTMLASVNTARNPRKNVPIRDFSNAWTDWITPLRVR